jgi:hypothetical protein
MLYDRDEGDEKRPKANCWMGVLIVEIATRGANLFDRYAHVTIER